MLVLQGAEGVLPVRTPLVILDPLCAMSLGYPGQASARHPPAAFPSQGLPTAHWQPSHRHDYISLQPILQAPVHATETKTPFCWAEDGCAFLCPGHPVD